MLEDGDRVPLEGVDRHLGRGEEGLYLLALHGDPVGAGDGPGRLREHGQVLRPPAAPN